jgi:hypothetical protein
VRVLIQVFGVSGFFAFIQSGRVGDVHRSERVIDYTIIGRVLLFKSGGLRVGGLELLGHRTSCVFRCAFSKVSTDLPNEFWTCFPQASIDR